MQIEGILKPLKYGSSPGRIHRRGPGPSLMEEEPAKETEQGWAGRVGNQERVGVKTAKCMDSAEGPARKALWDVGTAGLG